MLVLSFAPFLQEKVVMARFNNLSELKQEVRLHIIQMETSLFKQYQTVNHLLHNDKAIAEWFASKKNEIVQHAKRYVNMSLKNKICLRNYIRNLICYRKTHKVRHNHFIFIINSYIQISQITFIIDIIMLILRR